MIEIFHLPSGQEHPYEQGPEERFPRQPLAGESFTVGIVTRPPGAVEVVQVFACMDDGAARRIDAVKQPHWQQDMEEGAGAEFLERLVHVEQDVWQAALTAPAQGHTLTYWAEAAGASTPRFTLVGEAWTADPDPLLALHQVDDGAITVRAARDGSTRQTPDDPRLPRLIGIDWLTDGQRARRVRLSFAVAPDEGFYGLGERFNALNQRGEVLDVRCYEQYKSQGKRTYMPVPFLLSSARYGVYVQSSRWMQFDLAASAPDRWMLEADLGADERLDLTWYTGDDPVAITGQFARATGPAALPPLWAFGLWMSGNEWNTQARVLHEAGQSLEHGIQPSVLVIEAWSDETTFYIWNDAQYDAIPGDRAFRYEDFTFPAEGKWPDPKAMTDWLHAHGIRLVLWQIPVLKAAEGAHAQHETDRAHFEASGFGVREPDGSLYRVKPFWFRGGYLWDPTNAAANEWWLNKRAYLLDDMGVDGFKTDGGEHLWGQSVIFSDGRSGAEVWNEYPQRYIEAYYRFTTQKRGGDALTFSRAGFTGSQRSPAHWAGDENSSWDAYRHSIFAGLSAGISGVPFWGWDLGGFSGDVPGAELYLRGAAMAAFCPIMQYHSEFNQHRAPRDRTPWNVQDLSGDPRVVPAFRFFTNVRHNLMPYIWQEAQHAAATGEPMLRALALTEPDASPYAYFFGRDLLVFPVTEPGAETQRVTLPAGDWFDLWTGEQVMGAQTLDVPVPLDRIPVYVRAGAEIPVRLGPTGTLGERVDLSAEPTATLRFD